MGRQGLIGVRGKLGRAVAPAVSKATPMSTAQAEAMIGWALLALVATQFVILAARVVRAGRTHS
jgi:hypothetical protein